MTTGGDRLYELLPAIYRLRDLESGNPLQVLLRAIGEQAEIVRQDVDRLWDDLFIETCREWVVPYIGDLVGNDFLPAAGAQARVDVAKTVYYRRRKGTLPMLEELARDLTGWGGHAVEFFQLLAWAQNLNHLRPQAHLPSVVDVDDMDRVDGPFDVTCHTVDVRGPGPVNGWHNIPNVGFFLYRLASYPLQGTIRTDVDGVEHAIRPEPRQAHAPNLFHFSSLGARTPLFNRWRREGDEAGLATEPFVPGPIRPVAFHRDLDRLAGDPHAHLDYYGAAGLAGAEGDECATPVSSTPSGGSLAVFVDGAEVPSERIVCKDLSEWDAPGPNRVGIDVARGRIAFPADEPPASVAVEYHYGFSGDVGGGPYDRRRRDPAAPHYRGWGPDTVADPDVFPEPPISVAAVAADHLTIGAALAEWGQIPPLAPAVIEVHDDRTYTEDLDISLTGPAVLVVQASNERRPTLRGDITITSDDDQAQVVLNGFLIEGHLRIAGSLRQLRLSHCTLVPGRRLDPEGDPVAPLEPSILAPAGTRLEVILDASIVGPLRLPQETAKLTARRSTVDGVGGTAISGPEGEEEAGPPSKLHQVTVLGPVHVRSVEMASDTIFTGAVLAERAQEGCVQFSFVPAGSATPRRYRCQPDLALSHEQLTPAQRTAKEAALQPSFTSVRYHRPGYAQLSARCPVEIRTGAEDGSEMGVWAFLRNPHREASLRTRLDEYLPLGLEPAIIYVT